MKTKGETSIVHRPGPLKQSNKPHKGGVNRKKRNDKGRVSVKVTTQNKWLKQRRVDRKHTASQIRKNKRDAVLNKKRGMGSMNVPPILVAIIASDPTVDCEAFLENLKSCDDTIEDFPRSQGHMHINFLRQKQRFMFLIPKFDDIHSVMDAAKVADTLLFIHTADEWDSCSEMMFSVILAHSMPSTIHVVEGLNKLNPKKKAELKKGISKKIESRFPNEKLFSADTRQEMQLLLRQIGCQKQRVVKFRENRSYLLAEAIEFISENDNSTGTLLVRGYVRGQPLNVNGLVHIPGWENFQIAKIVYEKDPHPLVARKNSADDLDEDMGDNLLLEEVADPAEQESLVSEVTPDPMEGEQTWPTEEEYHQVQVVKKKVIKGTSDYQSAWIIGSDGEEISSDEEESDSDVESMVTAAESEDEMQSVISEKDEQSFEEATDKMSNYDEDINLEEEKKTLVRFREERMEQQFPDEQDTPIDMPARIRYQKYRGLKHFLDSPWDPMENLPPEYARIYRFQNFKHMRKTVFKSEKDGVLPGYYVTIHISNVPSALYEEERNNNCLLVCGLLPHEQKMSLMNVVIRKHASCEVPIKSKDTLIFHVGFRRFVCQPIFSLHSMANKFKYERFLPANSGVVASFFAPTTFPPASVIVFQQETDGTHKLVATGSMLNMNPNRMVIKRVVLSGHCLKVFKRMAVVRYMFFNTEDIDWFKRIELKTKGGRRGHIKQSLGSHGHMKCIFDRQLQSQDIPLMCLYKRVFPKWTYNPVVPTPCSPKENIDAMFG